MIPPAARPHPGPSPALFSHGEAVFFLSVFEDEFDALPWAVAAPVEPGLDPVPDEEGGVEWM